MKITLLQIGKTTEKYLETGVGEYIKRLKHYIPFESITIPYLRNAKNLSKNDQRTAEGKLIIDKVPKGSFLILLDERGKSFDSREFSAYLQKRFNSGSDITFVIGGAYGFSDEVYDLSNAKISFSKMTFSHQMMRLFFVEQIYRAMTIIKNEPYHH